MTESDNEVAELREQIEALTQEFAGYVQTQIATEDIEVFS
jgi:hypothetical protein